MTWQPITRESASATQAHLEALLGLNRATFNASAFLAQGNSAAFPEASPAERKALLGAILDPHQIWPRLADVATQDRKLCEQALTATAARIADREPAAAEVPERHRALDQAGIAVAQAEENHRQADQAYEQARAALLANAAAAEGWKTAEAAERVARDAAGQAQRALGEARQAWHKAGEARGRLAGLAGEAAQIPELEREEEAHRVAVAGYAEAKQRKQAAREKTEQLTHTAQVLATAYGQIVAQQEALLTRLAELRDAPAGTERCDHCKQLLGTEAQAEALASLRARIDALAGEADEREPRMAKAAEAVVTARNAYDSIELTEPPILDVRPLAEARRAQTEHAALQATIAGYDEQAARVPELEQAARDAEHALFTAQASTELARGAMVDPAALEQAAERTRIARANRRVDLDEASAARTRAETALQAAQAAASELAALRREVSTAQAALATYRLAERAYGRDGVPALIAENTAGVIEAEANRVLEWLPTASGTTFRVELRTQRALKSGDGLRETLDILVSDRTTTREFLTYSGGERFRVSFALRWALAKLLAGRGGAESRLLVIDEPDGLDAGGMDGLAAVLCENAAVFSKVLLVSHNPLLASAFEQVVEVTSDGDMSRLVA